MNKKLLFIFITAGVLFLSVKALPTLAQTDPSVEALQKQIQLLLSQMQALQQQVTTLRSSPATTETTPAPATTPTTTTAPPTTTAPAIGADDELSAERGAIPPPDIFRTLRRGSRGNDVRALQEYLAQDPTIYPQGFVTGFYGPSTEAAVRKWQAKYGVDVVGTVGPKTIAKFRELRQSLAPDDEFIGDDNVYPPPLPRPNQCPVYAYMPVCKEGQSPYNTLGCQVCQQKPIVDPLKPDICPALATVDSCPAGEERITVYKSVQCGVYYACKPRAGTPNTVAVLKKVSSIQTDNRYILNLYDPDGIQKFVVYNSKGAEVQTSYPACRSEWTSPVFTVDSATFPLKLTLADCASSQYGTTLDTPVVVKPIAEGLTFPYTFSNGKVVSSSSDARSYCYANGPGSGQSVAAECETKFGVVYTNITTTTSGRAIYLTDSFASCMVKYGFSAEAKQIKTWAQSPDPIPWSVLTSASQNTVQTCEREYYGQQTVETGSVLCTDGKDNDGDGFIDGNDPSCSSTVTITPQSGQKEQAWNSLGLKSWIRTDADSARIEQLKAACAAVPSGSNIWMPNAGVSTSADFGMPDSAKCQRASSCTASQYFDGAACVNKTTTTTTDCSKYGTGWHVMSDNNCYNSSMTEYRTANGTIYACNTTPASGCSASSDTCSRYGTGWHTMSLSDNNCYNSSMTEYRASSGTLYTCSATPAPGCSSSSTNICSQYTSWNILGSDGNCYNSARTEYRSPNGTFYSCSATPASGCISSSSTNYCSRLGSDWTLYGNYCLNSSRTQYVSLNSLSSPAQACTGADSPVTGCTPPGGSTTSSSDTCSTKYGSGWHVMSDGNCYNSPMTEYYNAGGTLFFCSSTYASGCSTSTSSTTSTDTCATKYGTGWHIMGDGNCYNSPMSEYYTANGTLYFCSSTPASGCSSSSTTSTTSCAGTPTSCANETQCWGASYYWYDGSCHSSPSTTSTSSSSCPSGYHSMGSYCMSDSNSSQCQPTGGGATYTCSSTPTAAVYDSTAHILSQIRTMLKSISGSLRNLGR